MFSPHSLKLIQDKKLFLSPDRTAGENALLRDCADFPLLASPLFAVDDTPTPQKNKNKKGRRVAFRDDDDDDCTQQQQQLFAPPAVPPLPRQLAPQEPAQAVLVPLYAQVQNHLSCDGHCDGHNGHNDEALQCVLQALLGAYRHAQLLRSQHPPHEADEYLRNMRNSLAGLWVLLAHVQLEIDWSCASAATARSSTAPLQILQLVLRHCPTAGNHGWISAACARLAVLTGGSGGNSDDNNTLQTAKDFCWDGMDRAHGRAFDERVRTSSSGSIRDAVAPLAAQVAAAQSPQSSPQPDHSNGNGNSGALGGTTTTIDLLATVLQLAAQLRTHPLRKSFYTFTDTKAAGLLCHELNQLSALERRWRLRAGNEREREQEEAEAESHCHHSHHQNYHYYHNYHLPPPPPPPPPAAVAPLCPVDAYPLLHRDRVYPPPPPPPQYYRSQPQQQEPVVSPAACNLAADCFGPQVEDDDDEHEHERHSNSIHGTVTTTTASNSKPIRHYTAANNYGYVVSPPVVPDATTVNGANANPPQPAAGESSSPSSLIATVQPPPLQGKHILPTPPSAATLASIHQQEPPAAAATVTANKTQKKAAAAATKKTKKKKKATTKAKKGASATAPASDADADADDDDDDYWMHPDWEPIDAATGQLVPPTVIRQQLLRYMRGCRHTKTAVLQKMNVNSNSFRKFMNEDRYKDPWRATENGTYWAAARLLEAARRGRDGQFQNDRTRYKKVLFRERLAAAVHQDAPMANNGGDPSSSAHSANDDDDDDDGEYEPVPRKKSKKRKYSNATYV